MNGATSRRTRPRWIPNLQPTSNDEVVAGGEYEVLPNARVGVSYTYRNLVRTIEDMSDDDGQHLLHRQPRRGHRHSFPKAKRTYHAVTVQLHEELQRPLAGAGQLHLVALRGNYEGLFVNGTGQLDPNINATFDLAQLLLNQDGPLSGDITHTIKVFLAKEFVVTPVFSITARPVLHRQLRATHQLPRRAVHLWPGPGVHPRAREGGRLPWVTSLDARVAFNYRFSKDR